MNGKEAVKYDQYGVFELDESSILVQVTGGDTNYYCYNENVACVPPNFVCNGTDFICGTPP